MKARRQRVHRARFRWATGLIVLACLVGCGVYLWKQKERLTTNLVRATEELFRRETGLEIRIGRIEASWNGAVRLRDVWLSDPALPEVASNIFRAERIVLRYPILDLISKSPVPDLSVELHGARLYWQPRITLRSPRIPFLDALADWMRHTTSRLRLEAQDAELCIGTSQKVLRGITLSLKGTQFRLVVPLDHVNALGSDVSSTLVIEGRHHRGLFGGPSSVEGRMSTQGTVVNWSPFEKESEFDLRLDEQGLRVSSTTAFGGLYIAGTVDLQNDCDVDLTVAASEYPAENLRPFIQGASGKPLPGRIDLEAHVYGDVQAPSVDVRMRAHDAWMGARAVKAADLQVEGVYPTFRISSARMVLDNGEAMRLPDTTVEAANLFRRSTYEKLLTGATQDTVILGEWEFERSGGAFSRNDFQMRKGFGEQAGILMRQPSGRDTADTRREPEDVRLGFEYRLPSKESFKFEVQKDERFVGVERKWNF